jgi:hypothetical protein
LSLQHVHRLDYRLPDRRNLSGEETGRAALLSGIGGVGGSGRVEILWEEAQNCKASQFRTLSILLPINVAPRHVQSQATLDERNVGKSVTACLAFSPAVSEG